MSVQDGEEPGVVNYEDLSEKQFREVYGYKIPDKKARFTKKRIYEYLIPSKTKLLNFIPLLKWLPKYKFKSMFFQDLITGLTIGSMQIPQGMAYASLGGVLPVYGLYTGFFPVLLYTVFGTSKHLSIGSYALTSIMVAAYLDSTVPLPLVTEHSNSSNITMLLEEVNRERILHANAITFFASIFLVVFGVLHLGFLTRVFARPFQSGFIFAVTILTTLSQMKSLFGVKISSYSGPLSTIWVIRDLCIAVFTTSSEERHHVISSVITSLVCIFFLVLVKILNEKYRKKHFRNIPIPGEAIVIAAGTLMSWLFDLETTQGVYVVGPIASGIPKPQFPQVQLVGSVLVQSLFVAIVGYSVVISLGQTFAEKGGYKIDSNQELFALGFCNFFGSMFFCLPSFSAMSRSCVQFESGGKTQIVGWISASLMLMVLLYIGSFFQYLPKACLASIVVVAVSGLFRNIHDLKRYWTNQKLDAVTWMVTCFATLLLDVTLGLICGIAVLLVCHLLHTSNVKLSRLEKVEGTNEYREDGSFESISASNGLVLVVKFQGPLNFFNASTFVNSIITLSGVDPNIAANKKENKKSVKLRKISKKNSSIKAVAEQFDQCSTVEPSEDEDVKLQGIVLDCSKISSIDSVGCDALSKMISVYRKIGIGFYLAKCSAAHPLQYLDVIDDVMKMSYVTVHGAVKACMTSQAAKPIAEEKKHREENFKQ